MSIVGNTIGAILKNPETIILRDPDGKEYAAAMTAEEVVLTAGANDLRLGTTAAVQKGVITGEKEIPAYNTAEGYRIIPQGSTVTLPNIDENVDYYDYTKLQVMICVFDTDVSRSVYTEKVAIDNAVYNVQSTTPLSSVEKKHDTKTISLGIVNDSDGMWVARYFLYKEI